MRISFQLRGFDALSLGVKYLQTAAQIGAKLGVSEGAGLIEDEAKLQVPVLSGRLRDSIHTESRVDEAEKQERAVLPDTPYAWRIEAGFVGPDSLGRVYHQAAQPYMRTAYDIKRGEVIEAIKDGIHSQVDAAASKAAGFR